jgi:hypothetical protein
VLERGEKTTTAKKQQKDVKKGDVLRQWNYARQMAALRPSNLVTADVTQELVIGYVERVTRQTVPRAAST